MNGLKAVFFSPDQEKISLPQSVTEMEFDYYIGYHPLQWDRSPLIIITLDVPSLISRIDKNKILFFRDQKMKKKLNELTVYIKTDYKVYSPLFLGSKKLVTPYGSKKRAEKLLYLFLPQEIMRLKKFYLVYQWENPIEETDWITFYYSEKKKTFITNQTENQIFPSIEKNGFGKFTQVDEGGKIWIDGQWKKENDQLSCELIIKNMGNGKLILSKNDFSIEVRESKQGLINYAKNNEIYSLAQNEYKKINLDFDLPILPRYYQNTILLKCNNQSVKFEKELIL